ncbi:MAG TPA: hypothetical protein VLU99_04460 [Nitrososphaerales archaeon]|nr:hypothetical protein [Nitrososphaerales archaeon]
MRAAFGRGREGILVGVGAALTLVVLLVLQSLIGSGLFSTRTLTSTTTVTSVSTVPGAYEQVSSSYANFLSLLGSRNAAALEGEYESNATVVWEGAAPGFAGNYSGTSNIEILLSALFTNIVPEFKVSNETHTIGPEGSTWVVNSTFDFAGNGTATGKVWGLIAASYSFPHVGGTWLISQETWNFLEYNRQFPAG